MSGLKREKASVAAQKSRQKKQTSEAASAAGNGEIGDMEM